MYRKHEKLKTVTWVQE